MTTKQLDKVLNKFNPEGHQPFGGTEHYIYDCRKGAFIILMYEGEKAGIIYDMKTNVHWYIKPEFRGKKILSSFLKTGLLQEVFVKTRTLTVITDCDNLSELKCRYHLAKLSGLIIGNRDKIKEKINLLSTEMQN